MAWQTEMAQGKMETLLTVSKLQKQSTFCKKHHTACRNLGVLHHCSMTCVVGISLWCAAAGLCKLIPVCCRVVCELAFSCEALMTQFGQQSSIKLLKGHNSLEGLVPDDDHCNTFIVAIGHVPFNALQKVQRPDFVKMEVDISVLQASAKKLHPC